MSESTQETFEKIGGSFQISFESFKKKLEQIKAFVFDWDGVFNNGGKNTNSGSGFSEVDSMGTNLLRFGYWLQHQNFPFVGIITGEKNPAALSLAQRESFHAVHMRFRHKSEAINHICQVQEISSKNIAFIFDDVLDLSAAEICGLRCLIPRNSSPLFTNYVMSHALCDYMTGNPAENHAVREISELFLSTSNQFDSVITKRKDQTPYQTYIKNRSSILTKFYTIKRDRIVEISDLSQR